MAVPTLETDFTSATADPGSSITLTKPASAASGKLAIIIVGNDEASSTAQWDNSTLKPTGFTLINEAGTTTQDCHAAAFYRVLDGTEGASINVPAEGSNQYWGYYIIVDGVDNTNPINQTGADSLGVGSTGSITGVTTDVDDCLVFYLEAFDGADGYPFSVSGTGWAEQGEIEAPTGGGGNDASGCWGTRSLATQGASGTATVTNSVSDGWVGFQFAIAPESVSTTPKSAAMTAIGVAVLAKKVTYYKTLSITASNTAVLAKSITYLKSLTNTALGVVGFSQASVIGKTINIVATGVVGFSQANVLGKTFNIVATAVPSLATVATFPRSAAMTAVGVVGLVKKMFVTANITAVAVPGLVRKMFFTGTIVAAGVVGFAQGLLFQATGSATALAVAGLSTVFIAAAAIVKLSNVLKPVLRAILKHVFRRD